MSIIGIFMELQEAIEQPEIDPADDTLKAYLDQIEMQERDMGAGEESKTPTTDCLLS